MLDATDPLRENVELHALLTEYETVRKREPKVDWNDRVMRLNGTSDEDLCSLHGILLSSGWLDLRVHAQAFDVPGRLQKAYRITPDGVRALRSIEDPFDDGDESADPWQ